MQQKLGILAGAGAAVLGLSIAAGVVLAAGPHGIGSGAPAGTAGGAAGVTTQAGYGAGGGYGTGAGYGAGYGAASGTVARARAEALATALAQPSGTLTADQAAGLASMAGEEKLALDRYTAFGERYSTPVWDNIAAAEATHLETVRSLLARYGISDPTAGRSAGDYATLEATSLYRALLAQGSASETAAWAVGATVEKDDIARLDEAGSGVAAADVASVYASLRSASEQHLASFTRLQGL